MTHLLAAAAPIALAIVAAIVLPVLMIVLLPLYLLAELGWLVYCKFHR